MGLATHIVVSKVHFWVIWDSYWLILWCQKTHIDSYCGVKSPFLSDLRLILWCQKSISEWFQNLVNLGLKKELGLTPPRPVWTMSPFFTVFFPWELPLGLMNYKSLNMKYNLLTTIVMVKMKIMLMLTMKIMLMLTMMIMFILTMMINLRT